LIENFNTERRQKATRPSVNASGDERKRKNAFVVGVKRRQDKLRRAGRASV
jgi:hypothetical protein